jgi:hypothetical protein
MARKKTGQKGGQYGNRNAVKHGGYMRLYEPDQRTRRAKVLNHIEASLAVATGPIRRRVPCGIPPALFARNA